MRSAIRLIISRQRFSISSRRPFARYESYVRQKTAAQQEGAAAAAAEEVRVSYESNIKPVQAAANEERKASSDKVTGLETNITELQRMINRANTTAARAASKENAAAVSELEAQVQRLNEGRIWARVREEEPKRMQAEEARRVLQEQIDQQTKELSACSQKVVKEQQHSMSTRHVSYKCLRGCASMTSFKNAAFNVLKTRLHSQTLI
eukprot:1186237-Pleurochrysis_carterae.AAC.2